MAVYFSDSIGSTPAMVDRETGDIYLNSNVWDTLPKPYQVLILEHEKGHYKLQTTNELEADHYAFTQIAGKAPNSLKNTVATMYEVLPYTSEDHSLRLLNMYRLALGYDYEKEPTAERLEEIRIIENEILNNYAQNPEFMEYYNLARDRGTLKDYEFPGYEPVMFTPTVGAAFRDFNLNTQPSVHWPTIVDNKNVSEQSAIDWQKAAATTTPAAETVNLEFVPEFTSMQIDWKSVAIGILLVLAIIGLSKI